VRAHLEVYQQPFSLAVALAFVTVFFGVFWLIVQRKIPLGQAKWLGEAGALTYPLYVLHHNIG
jgi:hypothetical protein